MTTFTPAQQQAIDEWEHNLQIIACAGSGKTTVVSNRVVTLLDRFGVAAAGDLTPEQIVAFTFTEKAAAEMKDRITRLYRARFGHVEGLGGMYVGTIHGFCLDVLQRYSPEYLKYDVLSDVTQRLFIDRYSNQSGLKGLGLRRYVHSPLYSRILGILREANLDVDVLDTDPAGQRATQALDQYQDLLDNHRYLDFVGMQVEAVTKLLDDEDVRKELASRVRYLIVDEYQDVNPIQESLVRTLASLGANVCVVGDDDQNIFQWRGSDVSNILEFANRYPDVITVPLEDNFRSTSTIVDSARRVVERNVQRLPKAMKAAGHQQHQTGDMLALRFNDTDEEAAWIAERIRAMRGLPFVEEAAHDDEPAKERGLDWSDFAILLRSVRGSGDPIVRQLRAAGVPFVVVGMDGLFDTAEAQAARGVFEWLADQVDDQTLRQLWIDADLGLTDADLDRGLQFLTDRKAAVANIFYGAPEAALQQVFFEFCNELALQESRIPNGRSEVVYYNLGKFSQVITDFEIVHYRTRPYDKWGQFCGFLHYQAPGYYPEGGQDHTFAQPNAVKIMTVHKAKGLEFPVVFVPALQRNRFPSKRQRNDVWKYVPEAAVENAGRYDTTEPDERRLMYVAMTRAERWLFCSWAPTPNNKLYQRPSIFFEELTHMSQFLTRDPGVPVAQRLTPQGRNPVANVEISFSDLKYFIDCSYEFKLRLLYGFNPPINERLGFGRSLHNALADLHQRAIRGERFGPGDAAAFVDTHLNVRYAHEALAEDLRAAAIRSFERYINDHAADLDKLLHSEESVELHLPEGIVVNGRIDLVRRTDTNETAIVDFKSTERAQEDDVTRVQLHLYALGYEERFGQNADLIEIHPLDGTSATREQVSDTLIDQTLDIVRDAGDRLRTNRFDHLAPGHRRCDTCDVRFLCRPQPTR